MPTFEYQGRDENGKLISSKRLAQSAKNLSVQLLKEGITPIHIGLVEEQRSAWQQLKSRFQHKRTNVEELSMFSRQMHTLVKSGVPITTAIELLAEYIHSSRIANALQGIAENLESGQDLASAMQRYSDVFTPLMISMIRIGQDSGRLDEAFLHLNQYLELERTISNSVKTVTRYPMLVIFVIVAAIVIVNIYVIPTFADVFLKANIPLPTMTILLIDLSKFFNHYWLFILIVLGTLGVVLTSYLKTPLGKLAWDKRKLKLPIVGTILKRIVLLRFARTLSVIANSGIPIVEGLGLVGQAMDNKFAASEIIGMQEAIQRGNSLTRAARGCTLFTSLELQILSVSEETGELGSLLEQIALFYQNEVEFDLKRLSDLLEPILIIGVSIIVLMLALAVYLPIWNLVKLAHSN